MNNVWLVSVSVCQLVLEVNREELTTLIPPELEAEQTVPTKAIPNTPPGYAPDWPLTNMEKGVNVSESSWYSDIKHYWYNILLRINK